MRKLEVWIKYMTQQYSYNINNKLEQLGKKLKNQ